MATSELKAPIFAELKRLLTPKGFRKTRGLFQQQLLDVVHLIEVQGSQQSTSSAVKITINLGVYVPLLVPEDVRSDRAPNIAAAHWRERLGGLSPESKDVWWAITSELQGAEAAADISLRLTKYGLPALAKLSTISALVSLWESGKGPGLTTSQRAEYLATLRGGAWA